MIFPQELANKGLSLSNVDEQDFIDYLVIKKACYEKYVDEYFGSWVDEVQLMMQTKEFNESRKRSCFKKILMNGETVGFFTFEELDETVDGVSVQIIEKAQNMGVGSFYLNQIISLSVRTRKPIVLRVFKSNPAQNLYKRFGFYTFDETFSHYMMRYDPIA